MRLIIIAVLICATFTLAWSNTAVQTDWSGGAGLLGPVVDWVDQFHTSSETNWSNIPGSLILETENVMHIIGTVGSASNCFPVDIDGDGDMDLLSNASGLSWIENLDGTGDLWTTHIISSGESNQDISGCDIDGDGDIDAAGISSTKVTWHENLDGSGTSWTENTAIEGLNDGFKLFAADIDGDGDGDIAYTELSDSRLSWLDNTNGTGTVWNHQQIYSGDRTPSDIFLADINGDSNLDIVCSLASFEENDRVLWFENVNGSGYVWSSHSVKWQIDSPMCVFVEDIDNDDDLDILSAVFVDDEILLFENSDGIGDTWITHTISSNFDGAEIVCAGDFDHDGDMDVVGSADYNTMIFWWENTDGSGEEWAQHPLDIMTTCYSVFVGDPDGDNQTEVIDCGSAPSGARNSWWDIGQYTVAGNLESSILYSQGDPGWGNIVWTAETPVGTSVALQVRASDDFTVMGDWSDTLTAPTSLELLLEDNDSYFQYRILMETSDQDTTPSLLDVTLTWENMGIEEGKDSPWSAILHSFSPNPSSAPVISFSLLEPTTVEFSVLDLSGRLVSSLETDEYCSGDHDLVLGELPPGAYFCHMKTADLTVAKRFVVIE